MFIVYQCTCVPILVLLSQNAQLFCYAAPLLVDLILEKKSQLFGSLSASFNFEEKNTVWDEVASGLSTLHGTSRNRDDVVKKWSNLSKHKPLIADKIASMKKTGGGPPGSELTPLEEKIQSIKGKQLFEGIASGVDITNKPTHSQVSYDSDQMVTSSGVFFGGGAAPSLFSLGGCSLPHADYHFNFSLRMYYVA